MRLDGRVAQFAAQRQALGDAKAVLLVDDGQAQAGELHIVLDHRVRAHHQQRRARGHPRHHLFACLALAAAGEPGDTAMGLANQRLEPLDELAKVLLGQDFGGRHQGALPAAVDGQRGGQRRHHRLARADVALQQAVHRLRPIHVVRDLVHHAPLRAGERKRQRRQKPLVQATRHSGQRWRQQLRPLALGETL